MATANKIGSVAAPATRVLIRVAIYYVALAGLGYFVWHFLPRAQFIASDSLDGLFGTATKIIRGKKEIVEQTVDQEILAITVTLAMTAAALVALPVAWIYTLTRSKRGYQQSVVQLLVMLPVVVAGIVVMVKYSVALAFSLGGIAAAVRFRNSLDDSKDAVYVFLVLGIGIAAAVDVPVAFVISLLFNIIIICLWMTDFGHTAMELDGRVAERRLQRARDLARTGTFVARIDEEVLANMSAEQLEGLSQRVTRRAQANSVDNDEPVRSELRLRVGMRDAISTRAIIENRIEESTKRWSVGSVQVNSDGVTVVDYLVLLKKTKTPEQLLALVKAAGGDQLVNAEIN